jgi:hypothetical protein
MTKVLNSTELFATTISYSHDNKSIIGAGFEVPFVNVFLPTISIYNFNNKYTSNISLSLKSSINVINFIKLA